jgi:hypothetical protein
LEVRCTASSSPRAVLSASAAPGAGERPGREAHGEPDGAHRARAVAAREEVAGVQERLGGQGGARGRAGAGRVREPLALVAQQRAHDGAVAAQPLARRRGGVRDRRAVLAVARGGRRGEGDVAAQRQAQPHGPVRRAGERGPPWSPAASSARGARRPVEVTISLDASRCPKATRPGSIVSAANGAGQPGSAAALVDGLEAAVDEAHARVALEHADLACQGAGQQHVVGVQPGDVAAAGVLQAALARPGHAERHVAAHRAHPRVAARREHAGGAVARGVVADDDLELGPLLGQRAGERLAEQRRAVPDRDADRDERRHQADATPAACTVRASFAPARTATKPSGRSATRRYVRSRCSVSSP